MRSNFSEALSALNLIIKMLELKCPIMKRKRLSHFDSFKGSIELNPRQEIFDCLVLTLVLVPIKADPTVKQQCCKQGAVDAKGAGSIDMILAFLNGLFGGLRVQDNRLQLGGANPCRTLSSLKVFFSILGRSRSFFLGIFKLV